MAYAGDLKVNFTNLIAKYGSSYTLKRKTSSGTLIDPLNPTKRYAETETTHTITGFLSAYDKKMINKQLVEITDIPMYVSPTITFNGDTDKITVNSDEYSIVTITPYTVNNDVIYYELQLRK